MTRIRPTAATGTITSDLANDGRLIALNSRGMIGSAMISPLPCDVSDQDLQCPLHETSRAYSCEPRRFASRPRQRHQQAGPRQYPPG